MHGALEKDLLTQVGHGHQRTVPALLVALVPVAFGDVTYSRVKSQPPVSSASFPSHQRFRPLLNSNTLIWEHIQHFSEADLSGSASWKVLCVCTSVCFSVTLEALVTTVHIKINQTSSARVSVCLTQRSGYQANALIKWACLVLFQWILGLFPLIGVAYVEGTDSTRVGGELTPSFLCHLLPEF